MKTVSFSSLWLAIIAFFCLLVCICVLFFAIETVVSPVFFIGLIIGFGGIVIAIISIVKAIKAWKLIKNHPELYKGKGILNTALFIDVIYILLIIAIFIVLAWLINGYSRGL